MKKIIACPACEWAKKLFTVERFETIDYFLDEIMDEVVRVCAKVEPDCQILL